VYKNITYVQISEAENKLDLPDKSVDLFTAFVSFHHFKDPAKLMSEILDLVIQELY